MTDLILWPCSARKDGIPRSVLTAGPKVETFLDEDYARKLLDARKVELGSSINSRFLPAIDLYAGHLYEVEGFREAVKTAISQGTDCLVLSGGYGLVRADEEIQVYERKMQDARTWNKHFVLASIFGNYLARRRPSRVFITLSKSSYGKVLFDDTERPRFSLPPDLQLFVYFPNDLSGGSPQQEVPKMQGNAVRDLIRNNMVPDLRWRRVDG